jgi:hypothetical protein
MTICSFWISILGLYIRFPSLDVGNVILELLSLINALLKNIFYITCYVDRYFRVYSMTQ